MYYNDHSPPHFHAIYAGQEAMITILGLKLLEGSLPRRAQALVQEWARLHQAELQESWEKAREGLPLDKIEGLD